MGLVCSTCVQFVYSSCRVCVLIKGDAPCAPCTSCFAISRQKYRHEPSSDPEELEELDEVKAKESQEEVDDKLPSLSRHKASNTSE